MKQNIITTLLLSFLFSSFFVSCNYLDREEDMPMDFDKIWEQRATIVQALSNVWGYKTAVYNEADAHPFTGASDDAVMGQNRAYRQINNGSWHPGNIPYNPWDRYWRGIREATLFMQRIPTAPADNLHYGERELFYLWARFARAHYYYQLVRRFGPVPILGNELLDFNLPAADLARQRNSMSENIEWIVSELRAVEALLPYELDRRWWGKPTKGVARAIIADALLMYARPLFNGNARFADIRNPDGSYLFPGIATVDRNRWRNAADAFRVVIDMPQYRLHRVYVGGVLNPYLSYQRMLLDLWTDEIIWGRFLDSWWMRVHTTPRVGGGSAFGAIGPTMQLVDAFAMANGRYPIIGYNPDGSPIIDPLSGYTESGFTNFVHPLDGGAALSTPNMFIGREPRFYAIVLWSGMRLPRVGSTAIVSLAFGGNSGTGHHDSSPSGFLSRKWTNPALGQNQWGQMTFPLMRLAEIYLSYAEALNEYNPNHPNILTYWNRVRERAGVPPIQDVYPERIGNQAEIRELIRRERKIELAFEQRRFFDVRQWLIGEEVNHGPMWGMNTTPGAPVGAGGVHSTPAAFWERTIFETRVFTFRHHLHPMPQRELDRNHLLVQNYGW